jgi:hypothetical protein
MPRGPGKPFVKGDPRRWTKGRGKNHLKIPDLLLKIGAENLPAEIRGKLPEHIRTSKTMLGALMRSVYVRAIRGESWAVQFIAERTEGKVTDKLQVEGGQRLEIVEEIVDAAPPSPAAPA